AAPGATRYPGSSRPIRRGPEGADPQVHRRRQSRHHRMSRGKVTEALVARIRRQVDEHQLLLWLDPDRHYGDIPALLAEDRVPVATYRNSVFELRHSIDGVLAGWERSPLVVYVPLPEADVMAPLAELAAAAVVLKPGQQPPVRNTRLAVVARAALLDHLPT